MHRADLATAGQDAPGRSAGPAAGMDAERLDVHKCFDLLRVTDVGRLAVVIDDRPEIFPINFVVDHGTVVFRTAAGTKLAAIASQRRDVAFEVDGYDFYEGVAWSVVVKGQAFEITGIQPVFEAANLPLFPWHVAPKPHIVRIEPLIITGRRFRVGGPHARDGVPPPRSHGAQE